VGVVGAGFRNAVFNYIQRRKFCNRFAALFKKWSTNSAFKGEFAGDQVEKGGAQEVDVAATFEVWLRSTSINSLGEVSKYAARVFLRPVCPARRILAQGFCPTALRSKNVILELYQIQLLTEDRIQSKPHNDWIVCGLAVRFIHTFSTPAHRSSSVLNKRLLKYFCLHSRQGSSDGLSSGDFGGRWMRVTLSGSLSLSVVCQPA